MSARRARWLTAVVATVALVTSSACSGSDEPTDERSTGEVTKVTYITSFGNFGRDSYVWVAKEKGYFRDAGIDVTIQPGQGTTGVTQVAAAKGEAMFAVVDFPGALLQIDKATAPLDIRAVGVVQQLSLSAIMALADRGITSPKDLEGKTVADAPGSVVRLLFPAYAKLADIDASKVKFINGNPQTLPRDLASGQVDAIGQFVVGEPAVTSVAAGKKITVLPYSTYVTHLYGNALWTTQDLIKSDPDLVRDFRKALFKGLAYSLEHPDEAGQILAKNVPAVKAEPAAAELKLMKPYVEQVPGGGAVNSINAERVARMIGVLQSVGAISKSYSPNDLVDFSLAAG